MTEAVKIDDLNIGSIVRDINTQLRKLGATTTVEDVYNGNNHPRLLVNHKGASFGIKLNTTKLDTNVIRIGLEELSIIAQVLANHKKTAIGLSSKGVFKTVMFANDGEKLLSNAVIGDLVKAGMINSEPYKEQVEAALSKKSLGKITVHARR